MCTKADIGAKNTIHWVLLCRAGECACRQPVCKRGVRLAGGFIGLHSARQLESGGCGYRPCSRRMSSA